MGRSSKTEEVYESTEHRFGMKHVACRVEVNVTDLRGEFTKAGAKPGVWVSGTMKEMNMLLAGCGSEARVYKDMCVVTRAAEQYTTERFGVLPSGSGQTLSVDIMNADEKLVTLTVPSDDLPRGAEAGGLVIFEYTLGATEFTVIVNGYRRNYVVIYGM